MLPWHQDQVPEPLRLLVPSTQTQIGLSLSEVFPKFVRPHIWSFSGKGQAARVLKQCLQRSRTSRNSFSKDAVSLVELNHSLNPNSLARMYTNQVTMPVTSFPPLWTGYLVCVHRSIATCTSPLSHGMDRTAPKPELSVNPCHAREPRYDSPKEACDEHSKAGSRINNECAGSAAEKKPILYIARFVRCDPHGSIVSLEVRVADLRYDNSRVASRPSVRCGSYRER